MASHRIYCSGPLFCAEEVGGMNAIAKIVEDGGFQTFVPHRDGLEAYIMRLGSNSMPSTIDAIRSRVDYAIFALDMFELLDRCSAVVCNLNGRVPDEGMIVEASIAYAAGKPVVLYKDDARAPFGGYDNSMLTSLVRGNIVRRLADVPAALTSALAQMREVGSPSSDLREAVAYGSRISTLMARLPESLGKKQWSAEVLSQVMSAAIPNG